MSTENEIVFDSVNTPNQNWVKKLDTRSMDFNVNSFKAPKNDKRIITLCKPFVVLSKTAYSSPVTLPLGLAYLGEYLKKQVIKLK